ncbi:hypothetical protein NPIL_436241 [Nephila pilipes]|uniref:Uncharacterized protein n=1 Tax=Nephila pilipes TaxID=299642 RepID=A0A8X6NJP8_NEPPI|nr:hypothetical protein NPIL_436241 [Nephila pilipes]
MVSRILSKIQKFGNGLVVSFLKFFTLNHKSSRALVLSIFLIDCKGEEVLPDKRRYINYEIIQDDERCNLVPWFCPSKVVRSQVPTFTETCPKRNVKEKRIALSRT